MGTFKDSLKKWFFQQGSKTPTSSTLIPTIDGASGTNQGFPNGYTTMANLSSGLGVIPYIPETSKVIDDFNDYTETGLYRYNCWERDIDNKPFSGKSVGLLLVVSYMRNSVPIYGKKAMQKVLYDDSTGAHTVYRFKNSDDTWTAWTAWT